MATPRKKNPRKVWELEVTTGGESSTDGDASSYPMSDTEKASGDIANMKPTNSNVEFPEVVKPAPGAGTETEVDGTQFSMWFLIRVCMVWFGTSCMTDFMAFESLPSQTRSTVGEDYKAMGLTILILTAACVTLVMSPIVGTISDRAMFKMGRRRPFVMLGVALTAVFLVLMGMVNPHLPASSAGSLEEQCVSTNTTDIPDDILSNSTIATNQTITGEDEDDVFATHGSFPVLVIVHVVLNIGLVFIEIPFNGLVADLIPAHLRGNASSIIGILSIVGAVAGMATGFFYRELGVIASYMIIASTLVVTGMISCSVKEARPTAPIVRKPMKLKDVFFTYINPFKKSDFRYLFLTRFLMMMGAASIGSFAEFWLFEIVELPEGMSSERAVSVLVLCLIIPAIPAALASGYISDRWGKRRKVFVVSAGMLMAVGTCFYITVTNFSVILAVTIFSGIGFGTYLALDYALALDVLGDSETVGLDLAVWHLAEVLPRLLATPCAALILQELRKYEGCSADFRDPANCTKRCGMAWQVLWTVCTVYFVLAGLFVYKIKGAK